MSKIELNDGSIVEGEITSLHKGIYTVKTGGLSEVKIDINRIRTITAEDTPSVESVNMSQQIANPSALPSNDAIKSEMDRIKPKITNNPDMMQTVAGLLLDPEFQRALKDPEIVDAVKSQNIKALMTNEKFLKLMNNQKLREIQNKLKDQVD